MRNITFIPFKYNVQNSTDTGVDGPDTVTSTLTVGNLTNVDHGAYTCRGLNVHNTKNLIGAVDSASTQLSVFGESFLV